MNDARAAILHRLTQAQPLRQAAPASVPGLARAADAGVSLLEQFTTALERVSVTWELADSPVSARLQLVLGLQASDIKQVLTWEAAHLPSPGLLNTLNVLGIETVVPDLRSAPLRRRPQDPDVRGDLVRAVGAAELGIVAAEAGLADTGALVMQGGRGRPLLAACLPRRLVVLLPVSQIFRSTAHWLTGASPGASAMLTFLTGPSQSLDLELIRAAGIHGPRLVHVVLIDS